MTILLIEYIFLKASHASLAILHAPILEKIELFI